MRRSVWIPIMLLVCFSTLPALAQGGSCPALVERALAELSTNCGGLERNSACYGYNRVDATFTEAIEEGFFSTPADRAGLITLKTIQTAPLDVELERWGVAVMNVQANVPNSLPGQAVTFLLLGDVAVENAVSPEAAFAGSDPVDVVTLVASNFRSSPSTNANIVASAPLGTTISADGLSPDGAWLRVLSKAGPAWISRNLVRSAADLSKLAVIRSDNRSPMQAFYFTTGLGKPACNEVPPSTLLVQSPDNVRVDITANGADIRVGSSIGLRTLENGMMQLFVIDGGAVVGGVSVPPGFTIFLPLSEDGKTPDGSWTGLRPMTPEELEEFKTLNQLGGDFLNYPIQLPDYADILRLQAALLGGGGGGTVVGGVTQGPAAGQAQCAGLRPTSPLGRMPFETVVFYWDPAPGATSYRVRIFNSSGALVFTGETNGPQTNLPVAASSLGGGDNFSWQVEALVNGVVACASGLATFTRDPDPGTTSDEPVVTAPLTASWSCTGLYSFKITFANVPLGNSVVISFTTTPPGPTGGSYPVPPYAQSYNFGLPYYVDNGKVTAVPSGVTANLPGYLYC